MLRCPTEKKKDKIVYYFIIFLNFVIFISWWLHVNCCVSVSSVYAMLYLCYVTLRTSLLYSQSSPFFLSILSFFLLSHLLFPVFVTFALFFFTHIHSHIYTWTHTRARTHAHTGCYINGYIQPLFVVVVVWKTPTERSSDFQI